MLWALLGFALASLRMKGMTFTNDRYCPNVTFDSYLGDYSLRQLRSTGADWIALVVTEFQDNVDSTQIYPVYEEQYTSYYTYKTASLPSLQSAITHWHALGGKVILKPHIDLRYDLDRKLWRGDIGKGMTQKQWADWFVSYKNYLLKYAKLAQKLNVQILSVSCQLITASRRQTQWRALIKDVRGVFSGKLTSSANWSPVDEKEGGQDTQKKWWDAVDYIGVDAYYPICPNNPDATLKQLLRCWEPVVQRFRNLTKQYNKTLIVTQIGYCSGNCTRDQHVKAYDLDRQALHYEAAIQSILPLQEVEGIFWWSWNTDPGFGGEQDGCISPQYKPAQAVVRKYYGGTQFLPRISDPVCLCTV